MVINMTVWYVIFGQGISILVDVRIFFFFLIKNTYGSEGMHGMMKMLVLYDHAKWKRRNGKILLWNTPKR